MNEPNSDNDFEFYQQVVAHITGSLDLSRSMVRVFEFLKDHFPIDGISLHQYSKPLKVLKLLFLVTKDRFQYVETALPLTEENARIMEDHEAAPDHILVSDDVSDSIADDHRRAVSHLMPYRPSSYLVGIMQSGEDVVGHLCFIGAGKCVYTEEQIRKMRLLLGPFNLAMSNMLRFKRVLEFQQKLYEEKSDLEKKLHQLRDTPVIGAGGGLHATMNVVRQLEGRETPTLILGETGTGKELIADAVQKISPRKSAPFIKVNCGAIPENLIDSELFGYEKGAFTGATRSRPGRFEQADGGTLFLDEVGELPPQAQVRFLRVLQNGIVERLGGKQPVSVNVRIIAATNRNLSAMIKEGRFREDLYYRLHVFPIHLPPLRERTRDIPALIHHFVERSCTRLKIATQPVLRQDTVERLKTYPWPGNVRELENLVERGVILFSNGSLELENLLPPKSPGMPMPGPENDISALEALIDERIRMALHGQLDKTGERENENGGDLLRSPPVSSSVPVKIQPLEQTTRESIMAALVYSGGRVNGSGGAAELLGLNPSTLRTKMRKLNIQAKSRQSIPSSSSQGCGI